MNLYKTGRVKYAFMRAKEAIICAILDVERPIARKWYCEHCGEYHAPRVVCYTFDTITSHFETCFLGVEDMAEGIESETETPADLIISDMLTDQDQRAYIGTRDVTLEAGAKAIKNAFKWVKP